MKLFPRPVPLLVLLFLYSSNFASPWKYSINASTSCALNTQSQNYNGNCAGSFMWSVLVNQLLSKNFGTIRYENTLDIGFGQTRQKNENTRKWSSPDITTDLISFQSILKFNSKNLKNTFASFTFNSQFVNTMEENNKRFLTPIELKESFGIYKKGCSGSSLSWRASLGGTLRQEFQHHAAVYDSNITICGFKNRVINDGGFEIKSDLLFTNKSWLTISSRISFYQALFRPQYYEIYNNTWYYPDIIWDSSVDLNVTSFFSFRYLLHFSFNKDLSSKPFIKQTLGASFSFSRSGKKSRS